MKACIKRDVEKFVLANKTKQIESKSTHTLN